MATILGFGNELCHLVLQKMVCSHSVLLEAQNEFSLWKQIDA